jgi:hypothetical protein
VIFRDVITLSPLLFIVNKVKSLLMPTNFTKYMCRTVFAVVFLWVLLLPALANSALKLPGRYGPVKLASGVAGTPGTVAWSPDGQSIAYIKKKVEIRDVSSGDKSSVKLSKPYFLAWAGEHKLMVLHKGKDGPALALVDVGTREVENFKMPPGAVAAYPARDEGLIWVFTSRSEKLRIGVDVRYGLYSLDVRDSSLTEFFSTSRILPLRFAGTGRLKGWLSAGPNPIGGEMMLLQFIVPPAAPPYVKVLLIDVVTRASRQAARLDNDMLSPRGSWSPLGRRVALVDEKGHLRILSLAGKIISIGDKVKGMYPAWDPRGGRIFFGGYLMEEDGSGRVPVAPGEHESSAFFSPQGDSMALAVGGKLWLLKGIELSPRALKVSIGALREKAALLRELHTEGFITAEEYRQRLTNIINRHGSIQ